MRKILLTLILIGCWMLVECVSAGPKPQSNVQPVVPAQSPQLVAGLHELPKSQEVDKQATQTVFGAEAEIKHPIKVPVDVLQILRHDKRIETRIGKDQSESIFASWFAASEIDLNDDDVAELIVQAANPHLFGANLVPFWVFQNTQKGYKLILSVDTLSLEVLGLKAKGYKDILTTKPTASEILNDIYEFDGDKYEKRRSSRKLISP